MPRCGDGLFPGSAWEAQYAAICDSMEISDEIVEGVALDRPVALPQQRRGDQMAEGIEPGLGAIAVGSVELRLEDAVVRHGAGLVADSIG